MAGVARRTSSTRPASEHWQVGRSCSPQRRSRIFSWPAERGGRNRERGHDDRRQVWRSDGTDPSGGPTAGEPETGEARSKPPSRSRALPVHARERCSSQQRQQHLVPQIGVVDANATQAGMQLLLRCQLYGGSRRYKAAEAIGRQLGLHTAARSSCWIGTTAQIAAKPSEHDGPKWGSARATAISWITGTGTGRWRLAFQAREVGRCCASGCGRVATPEWGAASTLSHEK
jgi:hypothetical protein